MIFIFLFTNYVILFLSATVELLIGGTWDISFLSTYSILATLSFIFVISPGFLISKKNILKKWTISLTIGAFLLVYCSLLWPEVGAQYFVHNGNGLFNGNWWFTLIESVPLAFVLISLNALLNERRKWNILVVLLAIIFIFYLLSQSNSSILHLIVSLFVYLLAFNYTQVWKFLKTSSNTIANSWKEWIFGPVRIINHGFYVGFGAFFGIFLAGWLAGPVYAWALLAFSVSVIIFSAIWAQIVEGSEKLKRPFGYYGALIGILFASFVVWLMGANVWVIIGVVSVVMPWVQAIGRLRCLINGCCHGEKTNNEILGIRYFHHRSRVCGLSNLKGELLHPTQLYAIIWLFLVGFILLELWMNDFSYPFIFGLYLIITGLGRFVEEAYRGEVQTIIWNGLRLYQWTAIITVVIGILLTTITIDKVSIVPEWSLDIFLAAFLGGFVTFFAMGVDFPTSNARFSRLV